MSTAASGQRGRGTEEEMGMSEEDSVTVKARRCPYDPSEYANTPTGQFHCPACGCMVLPMKDGHGICLPGLCPAIDEGDHPGEEIDYAIRRQDAERLGLVP